MEQLHSSVKGTTSLFPSPINFVYVSCLFQETAHNVNNTFSVLCRAQMREESKWLCSIVAYSVP